MRWGLVLGAATRVVQRGEERRRPEPADLLAELSALRKAKVAVGQDPGPVSRSTLVPGSGEER